MNSANEFYGKLGALLGTESDRASRRALAQAEFEVAELTAKVGRREVALETHRNVLAFRESLAASHNAGPLSEEMNVDVGRSLMSIAILLQELGKTEDAVTTYRNAEQLLMRTVATMPISAIARAALAECRAARWATFLDGQIRRRPVGLPPGPGRPGLVGERRRCDGRFPE